MRDTNNGARAVGDSRLDGRKRLRPSRRGQVGARKPRRPRITIMLDTDVVAAFRARVRDTGRGYQTAINRALREYLANDELETTLRRVVRENFAMSARPRSGSRRMPHVAASAEHSTGR